jgi:aminocarboxymuconate-semialdehyde decarboxylase
MSGRDYDHPDYRPFWSRVQELNATIILHPQGYSDGARLTGYYMINVVGNPLDSTVATMKLIFGGVLEEFPDLKIVVVHGGGYLPFYADRMDHAFEVRPECRENISQRPSEYLKRMYFDTMVFGRVALGYLVRLYGSDHVLLGTDYPYDMGESDPIGLIESVEGLDENDIANIVGGNAARLLELEETTT